MIVCVCKGVSDREVRRVVAEGARDIEEIGRRCGAGTRCGTCHDALWTLLQAHRFEQAAQEEAEKKAGVA